MIRKLGLVLVILAVLVTPRPAHGGGEHGGHSHDHGHHRGHHIVGLIYAPFPYGPLCWEEDHWTNQFYMDRYGNSTSMPLWVPPHWGCWY